MNELKGLHIHSRDSHVLLPASVILFYKGCKNPFFSVIKHCQHPQQHEGLQPSLHHELLTQRGLHLLANQRSPAHSRTNHCIQGLGFWEKQQIKAVPEHIRVSRTVVLKKSLKGKSALFEFAWTLKQHNLLLMQLRCQQRSSRGFFLLSFFFF